MALNPIGNDCEQQMPWGDRARASELRSAILNEDLEIATRAVCGSLFNGKFGRGGGGGAPGRTAATFLQHCLTPLLRAIDGGGTKAFPSLIQVDPAFVGLFGDHVRTELLRTDTSEKAPHRMLCQLVAS